MANRISRATIEVMFGTYADRGSVQEVATKYGVSHRTVERYRRLERWDERLAAVRAQAQAKTDYGLAEAMADSLGMVRAFKAKISAALAGKTVSADDVTVAEVERLVKLEAFLLGGVESRTEVVDRFSGWSDEDVERFAETGEQPARPSGSPA
jgi:hypothetical protein